MKVVQRDACCTSAKARPEMLTTISLKIQNGNNCPDAELSGLSYESGSILDRTQDDDTCRHMTHGAIDVIMMYAAVTIRPPRAPNVSIQMYLFGIRPIETFEKTLRR